MKRLWRWFLIIFFLLVTSIIKIGYVYSEDWKELKGDHFIVYYTAEDAFAKEVVRRAEEYYRNVNTDLGYERYSDFWQWDKRVKIYVYKTQEDFVKGTGRRDWSHGYADYTDKTIYSYEWKSGFLESLLPHEITHLIFRDYVGFQGEVPLWLDEGVAQWEEPEKRKVVRSVMRFYLGDEKWYSMKALSTTDIRNVGNPVAVELFYVQAASVVDFLVNRYGADNFIFFCRQLRDGKSLDEALAFAYPTQIRNVNTLEEQWKKYIENAS